MGVLAPAPAVARREEAGRTFNPAVGRATSSSNRPHRRITRSYRFRTPTLNYWEDRLDTRYLATPPSPRVLVEDVAVREDISFLDERGDAAGRAVVAGRPLFFVYRKTVLTGRMRAIRTLRSVCSTIDQLIRAYCIVLNYTLDFIIVVCTDNIPTSLINLIINACPLFYFAEYPSQLTRMD
jgi:hypothetical protein